MIPIIQNLAYVLSAALFIMGLKFMGRPDTAQKGNVISAWGMGIAAVMALLESGLGYQWIALGVILGAAIGAFAALRVQMTEMPEMVALFNGGGGLASLLLGWAEYANNPAMNQASNKVIPIATGLAILIGGVTFTGSLVAWAKLSGKIRKDFKFPGLTVINGLILLASLILTGYFAWASGSVEVQLYCIIGLSLILGVSAVVPIGGADMPVVISLLNSYSGLAAAAAGFAIANSILIVAGCLVGASGIILTRIMCKAMNRSLSNVLFASFGASGSKKSASGENREAQSLSPQDAYYVLEAASNVVFVPGYGMAVAQAQHAVRELTTILEENGCEVKFAIHPVAGRMPGHMNVLLAEANVPYDKLVEMDDINSEMDSQDVCIVIGANDVVNPSARDDEDSSIYGMPIIEADKAANVFILKRSMASGFAGIENPLFFNENSRMIFGDAKHTIEQVIEEFSS